MSMQDPTETATRRDAFRRALSARWRDVRGANRDWIATRDTERVAMGTYRAFIQQTCRGTVLEPLADRQVADGRHWTAAHITDAYDKGLSLAATDMRELGAGDRTIEQATARQTTVHQEALAQQYRSVYYTIVDHVSFAVSQLTNVYREAVENDRSATWLADMTNTRIRQRVQPRYETTAETAIVRAVNEAMLTAFEQAGVREVGVAVESSGTPGAATVRQNAAGEVAFDTAGDSRVCSTCAALAGTRLRIAEVRGSPQFQPPVHPGCRCRLVATAMETNDETIPAPETGRGLRSDGQ